MTNDQQQQQPRYQRQDGISYRVECPDAQPTFPTYDQADRWLETHEADCIHAHTVYKMTTLDERPSFAVSREL